MGGQGLWQGCISNDLSHPKQNSGCGLEGPGWGWGGFRGPHLQRWSDMSTAYHPLEGT